MTWLQFWLWVASFLISDYFRQRLPSQTAAGVGDFNIPTATEGRPVPVVIGGTMRVNAPNCIWYGSFIADPKTVTTGIVFREEEVVGYRYRLALQYALGKFEATGITGIWIGDDKVFDHVTDAAGIPQEVVDVTRYDLFGGNDSGGGFSGRFRLFKGDDNQQRSAFLENVVGLDPLPAYRGTCYVMITNTSELMAEGFGNWVQSTPETIGAYIGDQNQLRYIRIEVQTFDTIANGGLGNRLGLTSDRHFIGPDSNPVSVAYELYVNDRWGRAFPLSDVNLASFQDAANTCHAEGIGFSMMLDEQIQTSDLQDTLEQHIDGYIGPNPVTGQIEVTLSRQDYTLSNEFQVTDDNLIAVEKWNKGDWSQTYNRVRIRYVDRAKDWNETHAIELAPGNRIIQGRTVTNELRYQGCHTASVAAILAARAKNTLSLPQSSGTVVLDRTAWQIRPGSVMSFTSTQAEETNLAVRVTKIELGDGISNSLKAEIVADISGNVTNFVADPPPTDFVPPIQTVNAFDEEDQAAFEAPFILMRADPSPNSVPRIATLARRAGANLPTEYEVVRRVGLNGATPSGAFTSTDFVRDGFCLVGQLRNNEVAGQSGNGALSMQIDGIDSESLDGIIGTYSPSIGNFAGVAVISPGLATEEFIFFDEIVDDINGIRLENVHRSAMDTTWKAHQAGDRIWFFWTGGLGLGGETYAANDNVELKLLPRSPNDEVMESAATALPIVSIDTNTAVRNAKPLVPQDVTLNGSSFPAEVDFDEIQTKDSEADEAGCTVGMQHRLWRTQDIQDSFNGRDFDGGGLNPSDLTDENMRVSCWLHDLDAFPNAERSNALIAIIDQNAPLTSRMADLYSVYLDRADAVTGGATGFSFNARVELETKHSPTGQVANNVSHESFKFDFLARGIFTLDPREQTFAAMFNGPDAGTDVISEADVAFPGLAVGNAQLDTAQSVFGGASMLFDGTGDAVEFVSMEDIQIGTDGQGGNVFWTLDFRIRFGSTNLGTAAQCIIGQTSSAPFKNWYLFINSAGTGLTIAFGNSSGSAYTTSGGAVPNWSWTPSANTWYAVRIVRDRVNWGLYVDGSRIGNDIEFFNSAPLGGDLVIGGEDDGVNINLPFDGHIDQVEFYPVNVLAPATDTSYTVKTVQNSFLGVEVPLVANFEGADAATTHRTDDVNSWDLTFGATTQLDTAQSQFGNASLLCNGVDNLTPASADGVWLPATLNPSAPLDEWELGAGDFTMETFVRFNALPSTKTDGMALFSKYNRPSGNRIDWWWFFTANDDLSFGYSPLGTISSQTNVTSSDLGTIAVNTWYHCALVREGNALRMYFNGTRYLDDDDFFEPNPKILNQTQCPVALGRFYDVSSVTRIRALDGWLDGMQVTRRALYSGATYTVPTAPPDRRGTTFDDSLLLLTGFENSDNFATDYRMKTEDLRRSTMVFDSTTSIQTDRFVFGSSSLFLSGSTSTRLMFTPSRFWWDLGDDDFTIDFRWNLDTTPADHAAILVHWLSANDERGWYVQWHDTDGLVFNWSTDGTLANVKRAYAAWTPTLDTWYHIAIVRSGSNLHLFIDGVEQTQNAASDSIGTDTINNPGARPKLQIGWIDSAGTEDWRGYMDELRIIKSAEWTSNFTVPTAPYARPTKPNFP